MHVNRALLQPFPNLFRRVKAARQAGRHKTDNGRGGQTKSTEEEPGQPEYAAQNRGGQLGFPFVNLSDVFKKFDVAGNDLRKRHVPPAPEFRRGRARDAGDGRGRAVVLDRDSFAFSLGQRGVARETIARAAQQRTGASGLDGLGSLKLGRDALREPGHIGAAQRGHGDFLVRAVNGHRLQRRLRGQRVHDRTRETGVGLVPVSAVDGRRTHGQSVLTYRRRRRDAKGAHKNQIELFKPVRLWQFAAITAAEATHDIHEQNIRQTTHLESKGSQLG